MKLTLSLSSSLVLAGLATVAQAQPTPPPGPEAPAAEPPSTPQPAAESAPPPAPAPSAVDEALIDKLIAARLEAQKKDRAPNAGWKDGFFIQSDDGKTKLKIGGFFQLDGRYFPSDDDDPHVDQFAFRAIRPELSGTLFDHYDFRLVPDFAGARLVVQDVYFDVRYTNAFKVRFGKFVVPFGLERLQGQTNTTFLERGLPAQIAPNRDLGVQVFGDFAKNAVEYQVGVFNGVGDGQSGDADVSDDKELFARLFLRPFASVHPLLAGLGFGGAVSYGDKLGTVASPDVAPYKTAAQTTFFSYKTGTTLADTVIADGEHWRATAQGYYYGGPVGLLGEYVHGRQKVALNNTHQRVESDAWQVVGQWVITGDAASYKGVNPKKPFDPSKGQWGAFDVVARYGVLQVAGADVYPGAYADPAKSAKKATSWGVGADWFMNRSVRFVLDFDSTTYERGAKTGDKPDESSLIGRAQLAF